MAALTACSSGSATPHASTTPTAPVSTSTTPSSTSSAAADPLARYYHQKLAWHDCGGGFQCASLTAPLDYAHPSSGDLQIATIRQRSSGSHRGSLIINPGGPGASGIDFERQAAFAFNAVTDHYDLVSFDPRGVGASRPIRCMTSQQLDAYFHTDPAPPTAAGHQQLVAISKTFADRCWQRNGGYLAHVGTIDAARDMDVLRAAVGDRKLTYYGASYGTYLGAKYAQLFPTRIRAMVLDGAVDPAQATITMDIEQARGFETDLQDFLSWCASHSNCPLGSTKADAEHGLDRLEAQVRTHPLQVGSRSLGAGEFFIGLASGFYVTSEWPVLRTGLARAQRGDGAVMLGLSDELTERHHNGSYSNLQESNVAINCIDRNSPTTVSAFDAQRERAQQASPHFGVDILYSSLPCAFWHVPPVEQAHPVSAPSAPPILVIGTTHDPATPYADAQALVAELGPPAVLLTLNGDGHTAYFRGDSCILGIVNPYLADDTVPRGSPRCG